MNSLSNLFFLERFPTLDLHGFDRESGRVAILDFIRDNCKMKKEYVVIVHGRHGGILKEMTQNTLKHHKDIIAYQISFENPGCTVVQLNLTK